MTAVRLEVVDQPDVNARLVGVQNDLAVADQQVRLEDRCVRDVASANVQDVRYLCERGHNHGVAPHRSQVRAQPVDLGVPGIAGKPHRVYLNGAGSRQRPSRSPHEIYQVAVQLNKFDKLRVELTI